MSQTLIQQSWTQTYEVKPRNLRVLHLINGEHYSGAERVQDLLALGLGEFGYDVGFASLKPGLFDRVRRSKDSPLIRTPMRSRFDRRCVRTISEFVQSNQYSILHAHTPRSLLIGSKVARRTGLPLVYHVHSPAGRDSTRGFRNRLNLFLETRSLRRASRLVCVSSSIAQYMMQQGHDERRIRVVHNGVPTEDFVDRDPPAAGQPWTIGTVALFRPRKGLEILLEAIALLRSRRHAMRLLAVGPFESKEYERAIRRHVDRLGISDLIQWTGFSREVSPWIAKMDVFALPSLFGEGLPMVVLEAMATGTPVVATDVEGVPEAIRHGQDGLICPPGLPEELAAAIDQLICGNHDWRTISQAALRRQRSHFSQSSMAQGVAKVYRELIS